MLRTRAGLTALLALVFALNWAETWGETRAQQLWGFGLERGEKVAGAQHELEDPFLSFEFHDVTNRVAAYGYSIAYFFLFPLLAVVVGVAMARRDDPRPYRVLALAAVINYVASLGFYIFYPAPERWAYPESAAVLLSDRMWFRLIEFLRPWSGLDNCFPSFHVSLTVVLVLTCYLFHSRLRHAAAAVGATIVLSTFVLGIHWVADIAAGLAAGVGGAFLARWLTPGVYVMMADAATAGAGPAPGRASGRRPAVMAAAR